MGYRLIDASICALLFIVTFILCMWIITTESVLVRFLSLLILLIVWALFVIYIVKLALEEDENEDK